MQKNNGYADSSGDMGGDKSKFGLLCFGELNFAHARMRAYMHDYNLSKK